MAEFERGPDKQPSEAAYTAVADVTGADPLNLPPLANAVDPDALDKLVDDTRDRAAFRCEFAYADCNVTLTADAVAVSESDASE